MDIKFHKNFDRQYKKLSFKEKERFQERISLFLNNPFYIVLNNHCLKGKYTGYRSINVAGDLRAIYKLSSDDNYLFVAIGTHSELYS